MKLFGHKENEVEIDELEVSFLINGFQSYIDNLTNEKQQLLIAIDNETQVFIQQQNAKKQQISDNFFNKVNKYQNLISKIQKGSESK